MSEENNNEKYCIHCWLVNNIKKSQEELEKEEIQHQENQKYPGYENSEEGKQKKEVIAQKKEWINSHKTQLSELICLKNSTCDSKDEGVNIQWCRKCGKYLFLGIDYRQNGSLKHIHHKSPDFYTHEKDCQQTDLNLDNQIKSNQIKSNQIKSNQIKSNQSSVSGENVDNNSLKIKTNYLPWILGGVGLVSLVGVLVWFLIRKINKD